MIARLMVGAAAVVFGALLSATASLAQPAPPPSPDPPPASFSSAQIDEMVAPIALYPDAVLGAVLMAATYPDEVADAARWRRDPDNAGLTGGELDGAIEAQSWDPSVKSLIPLPQVLGLMDRRRAWTQALGAAFLANPAAVMDEVQKLRREARANGKLASNAEITVTDRDGFIDIAPADDASVSIPAYDPDVAFSPWPLTEDPPDDFRADFDDCVPGDFGYCWTAAPILLLVWGWDQADWANHRIDIDQARFTTLNGGHPPASGVWRRGAAHVEAAQAPTHELHLTAMATTAAADAAPPGPAVADPPVGSAPSRLPAYRRAETPPKSRRDTSTHKDDAPTNGAAHK